MMRFNPDQRASHRAGRQEQAAILLSLNPGNRRAGGKCSSDIHQGSMMAGDTLPRTQSPEGLREESFTKSNSLLPPQALGGENTQGS